MIEAEIIENSSTKCVNPVVIVKKSENSSTKCINPVVIVKKSNGELRICLDAKNLNKISIPMNIDGMFGRITNATVFSKIDRGSQFWVDTIEGKL